MRQRRVIVYYCHANIEHGQERRAKGARRQKRTTEHQYRRLGLLTPLTVLQLIDKLQIIGLKKKNRIGSLGMFVFCTHRRQRLQCCRKHLGINKEWIFSAEPHFCLGMRGGRTRARRPPKNDAILNFL